MNSEKKGKPASPAAAFVGCKHWGVGGQYVVNPKTNERKRIAGLDSGPIEEVLEVRVDGQAMRPANAARPRPARGDSATSAPAASESTNTADATSTEVTKENISG